MKTYKDELIKSMNYLKKLTLFWDNKLHMVINVHNNIDVLKDKMIETPVFEEV